MLSERKVEENFNILKWVTFQKQIISFCDVHNFTDLSVGYFPEIFLSLCNVRNTFRQEIRIPE